MPAWSAGRRFSHKLCGNTAVTADLKGILAYYQSCYPRDVFRLRRGLSVRGFQGARARCVPDLRPHREIMKARKQIIVSGGFDDVRSRHLRFLEEAARLGELNVLVWADEMLRQIHGKPPKFSLAERLYFLNAVRYVRRVVPLTAVVDADTLPDVEGIRPQVWVHEEAEANDLRRAIAGSRASNTACCRQRNSAVSPSRRRCPPHRDARR